MAISSQQHESQIGVPGANADFLCRPEGDLFQRKEFLMATLVAERRERFKIGLLRSAPCHARELTIATMDVARLGNKSAI
jgi:hypothetical protein